MDLLDKAVTALLKSKDKCEVLNPSDSEKYLNIFFEAFSFTSWGTIDWDIVNEKTQINCFSQIIPYLKQHGVEKNDAIYVIWGEDDLPVLKCSLDGALENIKYLTPVGAYGTWLYGPSGKWAIEFYHHGDITLGFEN